MLMRMAFRKTDFGLVQLMPLTGRSARFLFAGSLVILLAACANQGATSFPSAVEDDLGRYLMFGAKALVVVWLLLIPGLVWLQRRRLPLPWLPVPGMVLLAVAGLLFWVASAGVIQGLQIAFFLIYASLTAWFLISLRGREARQEFWRDIGKEGGKTALLITALVFVQAIAIGVNPHPVAQEFDEDSAIPGRMVASPPDHAIPYQTAAYMFHGYDGIERSKDYFGDWNVTSRGPLVPLGINTLFRLMDGNPDAERTREKWPATNSGEDLARIYGWALNACVLLGAFGLLVALGVPLATRRMGLIWLALSPLLTINVVFLWPKLLAAYFVVLAITALVRRRPVLAGSMMALAWLSHPVGALLVPAVGMFALLLRFERSWSSLTHASRSFGRWVVALAVCMMPWFLFKAHLGYSDVFFDYLVADGRGPVPAVSVSSWLMARVSNFWLTLAPGAFFFSPHMHEWIFGPISEPLRWAVQYAKTLPGHLGFSCFILAYASLLRRTDSAPMRSLRSGVLFAGFFTMIVFWGYSTDGLGRNALEPLSIILVIYAVASITRVSSILPVLFVPLALESLWLIWIGFAGAKSSFAPTGGEAMLLTVNVFVVMCLVVLAFLHRPPIRHEQEVTARSG